MHRGDVHPQVLAQILHYAGRVLLGVDELLVLEPLELDGRRIFPAQLQQRQAVSLLRNGECNLRQSLRHIGHERHHYLRRTGPCLLPVVPELLIDSGYERAEHLRLLLLDAHPDLQVHGLDDAPVVHPQEAAEGLRALEDDVEDIDVDALGIDDERLGIMLLQQFHLLLPLLGLLEPQLPRTFLHPPLEVLDQRPGIALEYLNDGFGLRPVFLLGELPDARSGTPAQMVVQADLELALGYALAREGEPAGAEPVKGVDERQQVVGVHGRAVGAEVPGAVPDEAAGDRDAGERLVVQAYPRIGLAVLQENVVAGLELLDEVVLQQEGVRLRADHRMLDVSYLRDHDLSLAVQAVRAEILGHAVLQVLGLAHVYDGAPGVQKAVHSRAVGQHFQNNAYICRMF